MLSLCRYNKPHIDEQQEVRNSRIPIALLDNPPFSWYSLFRKQVEHFCAKLELYSMQTQFSYGTLLSG
ncbi:MAG: hypothetical protein GDA43_21740, partial [Hormoscilla sp. SP5CHS1]|nr:hypothetical protein [Hormoscilla sp. SP5CHS1]